MIMKVIKMLQIWFWWNFIIKKNEFHPSLEIDLQKILEISEEERWIYKKNLMIKREIAHFLNLGYKTTELNDVLINNFKKDFL